MNKTDWAAAVLYCKSLSGLNNAPSKEYIAACYAELKDYFNKAEIESAARAIAMNEDLFGQYPPIKLWLKYCPRYQAAQIASGKSRGEFIDLLNEWATCDYIIFEGCQDDLKADIERIGGDRGRRALCCAGYSLGQLRFIGKDEKALIYALKAISGCWERLESQEGHLLLASAPEKNRLISAKNNL